MGYTTTGIARTLTVVVTREYNGIVAQGYPKTYDGRLYFPNIAGGDDFDEISGLQAQLLDEETFNQRLTSFKAYVESVEPGLSIDDTLEADDFIVEQEECSPPTTTTTEAPEITTTTEEPVTGTTTAGPIATTTTGTEPSETTTTEEPATTTTSEGFTEINYGYLYNRYATTDVREIANTGWRIPTWNGTSGDFDVLETYLGGNSIAGGKLKETGLLYWATPNTGATNEVGFNSRGNGERKSDGSFGSLKLNGYMWAASTDNRDCTYNDTVLLIRNLLDNKTGCAIRLIKNTTTLSHGQSGLYVGNDGKIYRTICIGTQEWLADNLAETKYNNGDDIPTVGHTATWAGLTSGAKCAYENNEDYV